MSNFIEITLGNRSNPTHQVIAVDIIMNVFPVAPDPFPGISDRPEFVYGNKSSYFEHGGYRYIETGRSYGDNSFSRVQLPPQGQEPEAITKEQHQEAWSAFRDANLEPFQKAWEDAHDFRCGIEFRPETKLQGLKILDTYERVRGLLIR